MRIPTLGLVLLAASLPACDVPTDPVSDASAVTPLAPGEVLAARASGAGPVVGPDAPNPFEFDENENLAVCVKYVPESDNENGRAFPRVIYKDDQGDRDGDGVPDCPPGFTLFPLGFG